MDTNQVAKTPSGLTIKQGQALAADMPAPPPPPVVAPVGKGKAPIGKGKGKGPRRRLDLTFARLRREAPLIGGVFCFGAAKENMRATVAAR
jgi:hypothetical protein